MKVLLTQKMAGISGSERYFLSFLPELRKRGIDAHFLVVQHPRNRQKNLVFVQELEANKVPVEVINSRFSISPWLIWKIAQFIKVHGFDLLQTNLIHADVWGACIKSFFIPKLGILSVKHGYSEQYQTQHGLDPSHLKTDLMAVLTRWAGKRADRVISISEALNSFMTKGGLISAEKGLAIPYGFDFSHVASAVAQGGLRFGFPQIVVAGRIVPVKQHHLLLKTLPALIKQFPNLVVVMVGAGPLLEDMKRMSDALGLTKNVRWEGFRTNMHDYIRDSDLMVIPSAAEGFGLVVLEAWHHATPVVAFDVPAINEIIDDGVNGILVKPFDVSRLLATIAQLLESPSYMRRMGNAGKNKQQAHYGVAKMVDRTLNQMKYVVKSSKSTAL
jgi:glycosyltransferase involved in cell wall biosynthesis